MLFSSGEQLPGSQSYNSLERCGSTFSPWMMAIGGLNHLILYFQTSPFFWMGQNLLWPYLGVWTFTKTSYFRVPSRYQGLTHSRYLPRDRHCPMRGASSSCSFALAVGWGAQNGYDGYEFIWASEDTAVDGLIQGLYCLGDCRASELTHNRETYEPTSITGGAFFMARLCAKSPTSYEPKLSISPRCVPRKIVCRSPLGPMPVASAGGRRVLGPVQQSAALEMAWKWGGTWFSILGIKLFFFFGQKQLGHTLWNFTALLAEAVVLGDRGLEFSGHVDDLGIISSLSRLGLSKYTKLQWLVITLIALFGGCPVCHFHFLFDLAGKIQVSGIPLKFLPSITP